MLKLSGDDYKMAIIIMLTPTPEMD